MSRKTNVCYLGFFVFFISAILFAPTASILFAGYGGLAPLFYSLTTTATIGVAISIIGKQMK